MRVRSCLPLQSSAGSGYTLIELMVAMVVALVAIGAIYSVYIVQQRYYRNQQLGLTVQQNLRGALLIIEQELRMAGYDPEESGEFGLVDVRRYDVVNKDELNPDGEPVLYYTCDENEDGALDDRNGGRNREHPKFRISDIHKNGRICLTWDNGSGRRPMAENIQSIGFAYAIDRDNDGYLDRWNGGVHPVWVVDSDNDNLLDTHIDINDDGRIDVHDDINGDHRIDAADGGRLNSQVPLDCVKAVRVWLLAITSRPLQGRWDNRPHVVGDRIMPARDDGKAGMVIETLVTCRNL